MIFRITIAEFQKKEKRFLEKIKDNSSSFEIPELVEMIRIVRRISVKAKSISITDVRIIVNDKRIGIQLCKILYLKNFIKKKDTLINSDVEGNFIFEVEKFDNSSIAKFNRETYNTPKITNRIRRIEQEGYKTKFIGIQSNQLRLNLKMIDGDMPDILAWALYFRYRDKKLSLIDISDTLEKEDPLNLYEGNSSGQKMYEYKIKKFLMDSAMGMTTKTPWHGEYDSFDGVVIVKNDGDIVCFHVYDLNLFRNYLLKNTFLEQPGTGEDELNPGNADTESGKKFYYGWLYEENEKCYFKINLQVRFTK